MDFVWLKKFKYYFHTPWYISLSSVSSRIKSGYPIFCFIAFIWKGKVFSSKEPKIDVSLRKFNKILWKRTMTVTTSEAKHLDSLVLIEAANWQKILYHTAEQCWYSNDQIQPTACIPIDQCTIQILCLLLAQPYPIQLLATHRQKVQCYYSPQVNMVP